jgi:hypothetical protein
LAFRNGPLHVTTNKVARVSAPWCCTAIASIRRPALITLTFAEHDLLENRLALFRIMLSRSRWQIA